ncbi:MAG: tetratricopeptide repeat protein [Ginsengibacter sp.]
MVKRYLFLIYAASVLLYSCRNDEEEHKEKGLISQEAQLKKSISEYPDSLLLTENLIEYYRNNGSYDTAIHVTNLAIQKDSGNVELWDIMGTLQYENGDTLKAIKAYEVAINIYPLPEYIISLGTLYAQTKNPRALVMADALVFADRSKAKREALFIKGLYHTYINDKKNALIFFDSCINTDYTYMFAYREKAIILYEQKKYEDALKVLTRAVTIQNSFDEGYYWMGKCYERLDSVQKAKENYQMALLYDKNFIEAKEALTRLEVK